MEKKFAQTIDIKPKKEALTSIFSHTVSKCYILSLEFFSRPINYMHAKLNLRPFISGKTFQKTELILEKVD